MNNLLRRWLPGLLLVCLLTGPAWGQGRIATVDLRKIFDNYWKKKTAEEALKQRTADMDKEDKNMLKDYNAMKEEYQTLLTSANESAISTDERDRRKKAAEEKLKKMKDQEELIMGYEREAKTRIGEQSQRMRGDIIKEIRIVVTAEAKKNNYSLVLDTAAESVNTTPIVLFTNNENDITDEVLKQLNANQPDDAKSEMKPASKSDEKKRETKK